jgi:uncharacterized protein (DUF1697 family)
MSESYVALLRAVNVGGTSKLPMAELKRMAGECGFADPRTYIASGNLLFHSDETEAGIRQRLEEKLSAFFGKPVEVFVRTADELAAVAAANPFPDEKGSRLMVSFLHEPPPGDTLERVRGLGDERIALGRREIYVAYGDGISQSKLKLPEAPIRTVRNINTVQTLARLAGEGK